MDRQDLASAARRRLRSTEAGTLEVSASGVSGERTPFVLTHEGRPLVPAAPALHAGHPARLRVEGGAPGAEAERVVVEGALRAASAAEAGRFAAFEGEGVVLCLESST